MPDLLLFVLSNLLFILNVKAYNILIQMLIIYNLLIKNFIEAMKLLKNFARNFILRSDMFAAQPTLRFNG